MRVKYMYLNQRSREILLNLIENKGKSLFISDLADYYNISERSIRYDLKNIDYFLEKHGLPSLKRNIKIEIKIEEDKKNTDIGKFDYVKQLLNKDNHVYTQEERKNIIFMELLKEEYTTIDDLSEILKVSRSTVNLDLIKLREDLKELNLEINFINKKGLRIDGNDEYIRRKAFEIIANDSDYIRSFEESLLAVSPQNGPPIKNLFEKIVEEVEILAGKKYTEQSFDDLVNQLIIVIYRIKKGKYILLLNDGLADVRYTKEFSILEKKVEMLEKEFSVKIPADELYFITNLFLEGNLLRANDYLSEDWVELHLFVNELIERISHKLQVDLSKDPGLFDALVLHLGPAFRRLQNKVNRENQLLDYIKENYNFIYTTISEAIESISVDGAIFNEDEIGFVTLHVVSALEKLPVVNQKLKVLIVCNSGLGTAKLLESKIKRYFDFEIINTIAERELNKYLSDYQVDLIISTIDIDSVTPKIKVSPLLTDQELWGIKKLENQILSSFFKDEQHDDRGNQSVIKGKEDSKPMLKDLLTYETIKTNVHVANWEEAIRRGGELLKEAGCIEDSYVDAMVNSVKELGPYIVIAPGIAMPHAKPGQGVKKIGFSLITLDEPVNFGHEKNDPVSIVICLAAIDHSTHLKALSDLVNYLNEESFVQFLKTSNSAQEIIDYINEEKIHGLS